MRFKVLVITTDNKFEERLIKGDLQDYQKIVGGYIEILRIPDSDYLMILNDSGRIDNLPVNKLARIISDYPVSLHGDVVIVRDGNDDFKSLTSDDIDKLIYELQYFKNKFNIAN